MFGLSMRALAVGALAVGVLGCAPAPVEPTPTTPPSPSAARAASPASPSASLTLAVRGRVRCALFPSSCVAALSVLPAGTAPGPAWRPPATDPRWTPVQAPFPGRALTKLEPVPIGALPAIPVGANRIVVTLVASTDAVSFNPDGSMVTWVAATCAADVVTTAVTRMVRVTVTFKAETMDACAVKVAPDAP